MAIAEMRRVAVIGHRSLYDDVLSCLQDMGNIEITEFGGELDEEFVSELKCPLDPGEEVTRLDGLVTQAKYVVDFLAKYHRYKKSFIDDLAGTKMLLSETEWNGFTEDAQAQVTELEKNARLLDEHLARLASRETVLKEKKAFIGQWIEVGADLNEVRSLRRIKTVFGTLPVKVYKTVLEQVIFDFPHLAWDLVKTDRQNAYIAVAYPVSCENDAKDLLMSSGFVEMDLSQCDGVPSDICDRLDAELAEVSEEREQVMSKVDAFVEFRPKAFALYDYFTIERRRAETVYNLGGTQKTFIIQGWALKKDMDEINHRIQQVSEDIVVIDRAPEKDEDHPVELENNKIVAPFEVVTKIMGVPHVGELDPTPFMAPFFFIFFGLCLADGVYGLAIIAIGLYLMKRLKVAGMGKQMLNLVVVCGLATSIVGALLGSWLGDLLTRFTGIGPILFDPINEPMSFIMLSFALGVIQIFFGLGLKAYMNIREGKYLSALYDQGFWITFLSGLGLWIGGGFIAPGASTVGMYMAIIGGGGLVLTQGRHHKNIFMKLGSGIISLYNTTSYVSDIISYVRLFGLGISSAVIAMVVNELAFTVPANITIPLLGPLITVAIMIVGHVFNLFINIIGSFVHSSRLQYVEFFNKFFEGGGRKFQPFRVLTKYVEVDKPKEA